MRSKIGIALLIVAFLSTFAYAGAVWNAGIVRTLTTVDNSNTQAIRMDGEADRISVLVPTLSVASILNVQVSADNATWYNFYGGGDNGVKAASASTAGNFVWSVPGSFAGWNYIRINCATAQNDNMVFRIIGSK